MNRQEAIKRINIRCVYPSYFGGEGNILLISDDLAIDIINKLCDNFENRTCNNCKYAKETNLNDIKSHGELFCQELVRFFNIGFGCNKWEQK